MTPLVEPHMLSHGTVECQDMVKTRRFYEEFLGIDVIKPLPEAQYMWRGGPWTVVCVHVEGEPKDQGPENRFEIALGSAAEVDAAYQAAIAQQAAFEIKTIQKPVEHDGHKSFLLQDHDSCWWEISNVSLADFDRIFEQGDVTA